MEFNFTPDEPRNSNKDYLKEIGRNLTDLAIKNQLEPVIGRDDEIRRIIRILSRKTKNNPVLVGEPGVGKTAIVEGLAQKIVRGEVPENLKDKEIIEIDMGSLIAGASFQGQFEKRIKDVLKRVEESDGQIMLFIDEVHTIVGTGRNPEGSLDAAQLLKPMLARGKLRLIGATTLDEYRKYIERDAALERRMQRVAIDEPSNEEAVAILRGISDKFETYHGVKIADAALVQAVNLSTRYIADRFLPDKAIDLVDEAAAAIQTEMHSKPESLEKAEQKLAILKMEEAALSDEVDLKSQLRLVEVRRQLIDITKDTEALRKSWDSEKAIMKDISEAKERVDTSKAMQQRYLFEGEYEKASILLYKEIPELETKLKALNEKARTREGALIKETVTELEIADIVAKWTQIPVAKLLRTEREKLLNIETKLTKRVRGQDQAIHLVADAVLRAKADINDPNRPLGSFIFMGPSGVGKTEVAKALAEELFESEKRLIRLDMSEYGQEQAAARMIGSPPGYVGYEEGGQLTEAVRRHPYSIVLFDEIEKAHPKVLQLLLQILDEGTLTDGHGKVVNFKNTILILTTNMATMDIIENRSESKIRNTLFKFLRPEFVNRIDEVVIFRALEETPLREIVELELEKLSSRLALKQFLITFDQNVTDKIVSESYDPLFGARPLKRYISREIEPVIAKLVINGSVREDVPYQVEIEQERFVLKRHRLN